jgi:lysophospholipase
VSSSPSLANPAFNRRAIPAGAIETYWPAADGHPIRRIDWPAQTETARGSLLFMPGRGDCYEKYLETLDYWHLQGWQVTASDWRGQAFSGRLGADAYTGHVDDFAIWVGDLAELWHQWTASTPPPHVLVGHSMGGHLVLRALAEQAVNPDAAVLIAPMLGFLNHGVPAGVMQAAAWLMTKLGDHRRQAWRRGEKPQILPADRNLLLTSDDVRYADELWWREARPELAMGPGSWGWTERAFSSTRATMQAGMLEGVKPPVLIVATDHDKLVEFRDIASAAKRIPHGEMLRFGAESRHEILREVDAVRDRALTGIDAFLDRATRRA